jgi:hypothetical protein
MGILDYFREGADYGSAYGNEQQRLQEEAIAAQNTVEADRRNKATLKVVPAAIARLPTSIIEGVQGIDQIISSLGERSGSIPENLQRARYRKGGFEKVQELLATKQAEWQAANPDATPEQVKEFVSKYQNTPEYIDAERQHIPTAYRINEEVGDWIDKKVGAPTDNLKTNTENVIQNVTQALVPVGVAKGLPKAARIAAEFLLPGNQAATTGGKLAVGATAGGATAGIQAGMGRDVKPQEYTDTLPPEPPVVAATNFPELNTADGVEPPVTANASDKAEQLSAFSQMIPGIPSLAIFGMLGAAAGIRPKMAPNVADAGPVYASKPGVVGPTVAESAKDLRKATGGVINNAIDERSPIQRAIADAEGSYADGVKGANEVGIHSPSAAGTSKRNHSEYGFLGDQQVTPLARLDDMRTALRDFKKEDGTDGWDNVSKYLLARSELGNRGRYIDEVNDSIQQKYIEHTAAVNAKDVAKANDVMQEIVKLQDDLKTRMDKRFQLQQHSTDELKDLIKNGPDVPGDDMKIGTRYVAAFDENNKAWMKQLEKDGLIEPEVIAKINKHHDGSYAPMIEDELKGAKGISRVFAKATRSLENIDDLQSRLQQRVNPFSQRDIREGAEGTEFLMDPHNALFKRSNQYHNWREQQLYVRDVVERIVNGKNADNVIEEKLIGSGGRTAFSDAEVHAMSQKRDLSEFTPVKLRGNNGKTSFIKFRDPLLSRTLMAGPMNASIWKAAASMLQRGATGAWNIGFAPMSTMLENGGIQLMRPRGSVGPTSHLIGKTVGLVGGDKAAKSTMDALESVSHVMKPADLLVGQAEAVYGAAQLFWKQNRIKIADNMLSALATGDGWFGQMMNIPAFRAFATKWGQNTVDTFHDTLEGALLDGKGMTFNTLAKNLEHTRELEKFMDVHVPSVARLIGSAAAEPFTQMKTAITSYRDAAKWMHYNRQVSYNALKYGGEDKIPEKVLTGLQNEIRTLTGDFTKRMGNSKAQFIDDTIPYFRVMIQSNKNFYQRIRSDPKLAGAVIGGIVVPKLAFEYEMANWDKEAYDWYYRQTSAYDRSGFVGFVRPDIMYRRHVLGEEIPFSPDHVYKLFSPQEARPITEAITQAIRGLGAYKAGQKDKVADTSIGSQFQQALAAAFSPGVPPPVAAILAQNGVRLDPGALFKGENPVKSDSDKDRVNKMLATDSNVTNGIHNTLGALMGGIGKSLAQGYATGEQVYKRTGKIEDAIWKGASEVKDRVMEGRAEPLPWLDMINTRRYRQTAVTDELYKNREAFSVISGSRTGGKAFTPTDPLLATITDELRMASKTYEPKDFSTRFKELDTELKAIEDNRSVPVKERQRQSEDKLKALHQLSIEQQKWMLKEEKNLALREIEPGMTIADAYKQKFGQPFSLQNFASTVKKLKNAAAK